MSKIRDAVQRFPKLFIPLSILVIVLALSGAVYFIMSTMDSQIVYPSSQVSVRVNTDDETAAVTTALVTISDEEGQILEQTIECNTLEILTVLDEGVYKMSVAINTDNSEYSLGIRESNIDINNNTPAELSYEYYYTRESS